MDVHPLLIALGSAWASVRASSAAFGHTALNALESEGAALATHVLQRLEAVEKAAGIAPPAFKQAPAATPAAEISGDAVAAVQQLAALVQGLAAKLATIAPAAKPGA